ncbi:Uncharacterized protein Fot_20505 [Forsythia ovata]|uniref:Uncharacterized protein n=1 Tax=Forsythia ovata TaxID=205694 RepID=A0ABD1US61_9LAMI
MILATHWVILWESRNILKENTIIISNGFVRNAPKDMLFNQITRLTSKPVELEAIPVIVAVFSQALNLLIESIDTPEVFVRAIMNCGVLFWVGRAVPFSLGDWQDKDTEMDKFFMYRGV